MWKFPLFEALAAFGQSPVTTRAARRRPLSRHYRNPKDPHQAARIKAAKMKRSRKEAYRCWAAAKSYVNNRAFQGGRPSLYPFLPIPPVLN
ncbi:hypothetical protein [Halopseudomonas sp.]|uniref:hypothetical protein n=1 Tax=Halopseudomonas sp. TaxID=2901191 RepID=UPI00311F8321